MAYSPLGRGYLTGKLDSNSKFDVNDNRGDLPRFTQEAMQANQVLIDFMNNIAKEKKATTAQIAIAWILDQKPWIVPIPGTTNPSRIIENIGATEIVFSTDERNEIAKALDKIQIIGDRYSEEEKRRTGN